MITSSLSRRANTAFAIPILALGLMGADEPAKIACLGQAEARQLMREQNLRNLPDAMAIARQKIRGDIISADLCRIHGVMVYVFAVMGEGGRVHRLQVEANAALAAQ